MSDDLFASTARAGRRLRRPLDRGARGAGAGPAPAGHVYRRHRRAGASPSRRRGARQRMDEAVAGHATRIEVTLEAEAGSAGRLTIADNGRGIPIDEHPKYPGKSALEVILTMLHSGGKFSRQGLCDLGRPARRRRLAWSTRCRATRSSRWRGTSSSTARPSRAACRPRRWSRLGRDPEPARHHHRLHARRGDFRRGGEVQAGAALPAGALQGLSVRRRRDPLEMRSRR